MMINNTLQQTDNFAVYYDEYIAKSNWYGPQMLFGLLTDYIKPNDNLLDLGIGTGLSSQPFFNAGLKIYGVDGSDEMIKICQKKGITEDIKIANLENFKSPYGLSLFDHAISVGVFHLIGDLKSIFSEVSRSLHKDSTFSFTINEYKKQMSDSFVETIIEGVYCKPNDESGIIVFQHSLKYILQLLKQFNFKLILNTEFLAYRNTETKGEYYFSVFIVRKID
jgi:predicted TPR repeat methyltransferase